MTCTTMRTQSELGVGLRECNTRSNPYNQKLFKYHNIISTSCLHESRDRIHDMHHNEDAVRIGEGLRECNARSNPYNQKLITTQSYNKSFVSLAIANSSFVGTTTTFTREESVEITSSWPRCLFFSWSSSTPRNSI